MEAAIGFEPMNEGFADLCLSHLATPPDQSTDIRLSEHRLKNQTTDNQMSEDRLKQCFFCPLWSVCLLSVLCYLTSVVCFIMERVAGLEPVTPTLARLCSTS